MGVKISQLKQEDIRVVVSIDGIGDVTIYNPKGSIKEELLKFIKNKMGKKGVEINQHEVVTLFMSKLTDLEIDVEDISEVMDVGTIELTKIMFYLTTIVQELTYEILCQQNLELQMVEKTLLAYETTELTNSIEKNVEEKNKRKKKEK
ncbi:MAG: hypothetical protein ACRDA3_13035 [Peptostreptococcaceae bacterium]